MCSVVDIRREGLNVSEGKDYYEILGVDRDADQRTIKRAFLKKARKVHPDVSDDPEAESKFKELNEAYSVLSDEQKRANYDRFGTADGPMGRVTLTLATSLVGRDWTTSSRPSLAVAWEARHAVVHVVARAATCPSP